MTHQPDIVRALGRNERLIPSNLHTSREKRDRTRQETVICGVLQTQARQGADSFAGTGLYFAVHICIIRYEF
jgi:hypothetical protein